MMTDAEYEIVQAKIVELQNENYASPEAANLQAWLGEVVVRDYLDSLKDLPILDGEVIETVDSNFWLDS